MADTELQATPSIIQGLENIRANSEAIGAAPDPEPLPQTEQAAEQPAPAQSAPALTLEERIKQDEELQAHIDRERARAVTLAQKKWNDETLQRKLQADRQQRDEAIMELANRAQNGDADALAELGRTVVAQVTRKVSAEDYAREWFAAADDAVRGIAGDEAFETLDARKFTSVKDWTSALVEYKTAQAKAELDSRVEKLAEAKAADLITARRQNIPDPDLTRPVAGGGTPKLYKTLAEAATLLNEGKLDLFDYQLASEAYTRGEIPAGSFGENI